MKIWVVASEDGQLAAALRDEVVTSGAAVDLIPVYDHREAIRAIGPLAAQRLLLSAQSRTIDCLDLVCAALGQMPGLETVVCSTNRGVALGPTSLETGVCFVHTEKEAVALASPAQQARRSSPEGPLRRPDIVDVVRIVAHARQSRVLNVTSGQGDGVLGFVDGSLIHAAAGTLRGNDAFLQMVLWEESRFTGFETEAFMGGDANVSAPLEELLEEAVGLRMAIEGEPHLVDDRSRGADVLDWWARATAEDKSMVRVLVGFDAGATCGCVQKFTEGVSGELNPVKHWASEPEDGPSFVRVHTEGGGILSLTFVPMEARNRFYFDTFCRRSDAVVICKANENGEVVGWRECIPSSVPTVVCNDPEGGGVGPCPAVRIMVEEEG